MNRQRKRYQLSSEICKKYNVQSYPFYIFLNSEGVAVHNDVGFAYPAQFLQMVQNSFDPQKQYYTLLEQFKSKKKK